MLVLILNIFDRCFSKIADGEEAYQLFQLHIEKMNNLMTTYNDVILDHVKVSAEEGSVLFPSALFGCVFTLKIFAKICL